MSKYILPLDAIFMRPDYSHKIFDDKRLHLFFLMEALTLIRP